MINKRGLLWNRHCLLSSLGQSATGCCVWEVRELGEGQSLHSLDITDMRLRKQAILSP